MWKGKLSRPPNEVKLPNNLDAERSILGCILLNFDKDAILAAQKHIKSSDFFLTQNQVIYRTLLKLRDDGQPIDFVSVCEALGKTGDIDRAGGAAYISSLVDDGLHLTNVEHYAKIVREKARLRTFIHLSDKIQQMAMDGSASIEDIRAKLYEASNDDSPVHKIVGGNGHLTYSLAEFLTAEFPTPEHLVEGLIPRGGTAMIVAMPHHLKSWFTTSLALATSVSGMALGKLEVKKPVRTMLVQMEEFPGVLQGRLRSLLSSDHFQNRQNCEPGNIRIFPRCDFFLPDNAWFQRILHELTEFKADHVIFDVVRRIFRGDINSSKETIPFLEALDRLRELTGVATTLVHHENRKEADLLYASAGSYTLTSWANTVMQFKRKVQEGNISHVEIEADAKLAQSPEPMRLRLDLTSEAPVILEALEDTSGVQELRDQLGEDWTIRDIQEVLGVAKSSAMRRVKKMMAANIIEKLTTGKRGRAGGLARYHWVGSNV